MLDWVNAKQAEHWISEAERLGREADEALERQRRALEHAKLLNAEARRLLDASKQADAAMSKALDDAARHGQYAEELHASYRQYVRQAERAVSAVKTGEVAATTVLA